MSKSTLHWPYVGLAVVIGVISAAQAKVNGELGFRLGDALFAAVVSFGLGFLVLLVIMLMQREASVQAFHRLVDGLKQGSLKWPVLLIGLIGAVMVYMQGALVNIIGVALFSVALVSGQTIGGIVADLLGVSGVRKPLTMTRLLGAVLMLIAVILVASLDPSVLQEIFWLIVFPFISGMGTAFQHAMIGQVRHVTHSVQTSTMLNFAGGTLLLMIIAGVSLFFVEFPTSWPSEPWLYIGGVLGVMSVLSIAYIVRHIGVLVLSMAITTGQLLTSAVIDLVFPVGKTPDVYTYIGIALAVLGVGLAGVKRSAKAEATPVLGESS